MKIKTKITALACILLTSICFAESDDECCPGKDQLMSNLDANKGNKKYSFDGKAGKCHGLNGFPEGTNKCNKFVNDMLKSSGYPVPEINGQGYGPQAGDWASSAPDAVPCYEIVTDPKPGDVAAYDLPDSPGSFTGHCGIVNKEGKVEAAHGNRGPDTDGENVGDPNPFQDGSHETVYRRLKPECDPCKDKEE